jgi:hypothetical protein
MGPSRQTSVSPIAWRNGKKHHSLGPSGVPVKTLAFAPRRAPSGWSSRVGQSDGIDRSDSSAKSRGIEGVANGKRSQLVSRKLNTGEVHYLRVPRVVNARDGDLLRHLDASPTQRQ